MAMKKLIVIIVFSAAFIFFLAGDNNNEALEIHNNGATMCMACIGLE